MLHASTYRLDAESNGSMQCRNPRGPRLLASRAKPRGFLHCIDPLDEVSNVFRVWPRFTTQLGLKTLNSRTVQHSSRGIPFHVLFYCTDYKHIVLLGCGLQNETPHLHSGLVLTANHLQKNHM